MRSKKASHNLYNETGMYSLFSVRKLIGNMFLDSIFDAISPGKIGCIVKALVLPIWKRVKEIDQILIWDKAIELSGPDNGIVATGDLCAILSDGKEGILSSHDKRLDSLS